MSGLAHGALAPGASGLATRAGELDDEDPLARYAAQFVESEGLVAYLDGNSLGRPLRSTAEEVRRFIDEEWGGRLIRGWDERWLAEPFVLGDRLGAACLGAAPGQTVIADSTTVNLYKLIRAAVELGGGPERGRTEIVADTDNFPTDRYLVEGIAAERDLTLRWIQADPSSGVTPAQASEAITERTAVVVLSHVAYRSGYLADGSAITELAHRAGALMVWDLCHSVGSVPVALDEWGADFAAGCTYKYLNGGPGSPAFAYVAKRHLGDFRQPVQGWLGRREAFEMASGYEPAEGIRRFVSGTPPIFGMLPLRGMLSLVEEVGIAAIREKSVKLTEFAIAAHRELLEPLGVRLASPRDAERRGGHVTLEHPEFRALTQRLWGSGVIPDFRAPQGLRLGLSPLSTSFREVLRGVEAVRAELSRAV
ncbi:kynureninase [Sinomonas terrae]|uniref:Kynureninase n=1 Tax=Sinomonas terrae TaxID=2908838 RepID=A0ABS9U3E5_9MICC|nr:aminotransferase class V-fold PLP-dependent enzyme [Sinomonas terrae]MCH6470922.1 aminotransferase class V-fold PLP-dependent enzyme [Sinomonas terrae]